MELPQKFVDRMRLMLGDEFETFMRGFEMERAYGLRLNTMKMLPEEFETMAPFPLQRVPWVENGYYYQPETQPTRNPLYFSGLYYMQEPSAMTPATRLPVRPGEKVLDLCAAPGGKATELGCRLRGEGLLVANEISASRAKALLKNIELAGITNALITNETPINLSKRFPEYFDKILVDAPCSGEGMFRKEPGVAETWEEGRPVYFAGLQKDILEKAVRMLRPGGLLLYSTCTFSAIENEGSVSWLLENHPEMSLREIRSWEGFAKGCPSWGDGNPELQKCVRIWPHKMPGEGHFMALLKKDGEQTDVNPVVSGGKPLKALQKEEKRILSEFLTHVKGTRFQEGLELRGEQVYYVKRIEANLRGIKFLRNGLYLGELKKKRFEPSQAFAMALRGDEFDNILSLPAEDERLLRYLKGETIQAGNSLQQGWCLVCVEGLPLGWGKITGSILKNKYLHAWRIH